MNPEMNKRDLERLVGLKILVADDDEYNRMLTVDTLLLKIKEVVVDEAYDGQMAIELLSRNTYDVILMDLVMPKLNGFETTWKIRHEFSDHKKDSIILGLTSSADQSEIDRCFEVGMNGFIRKPFKSDELTDAIYDAIYDDITSFTTDSVPKSIATQTGDITHRDALYDFSEGDDIRFRRLVDVFLTKIPVSLQKLNQALLEKEYDSIRIIAHSMKPQLHSAGMSKALVIASSIEEICIAVSDWSQLPDLINKLAEICEQAMVEIRKL